LLPSLPTRSPWIFALVACLLAAAVSVGVVFAIDYSDQSFRTPSEVLSELRIPVLAAVPVHQAAIGAGYQESGNGNGNGNGSGRADNVRFDPAGAKSPIIQERG
jgi:hypothetical protein